MQTLEREPLQRSLSRRNGEHPQVCRPGLDVQDGGRLARVLVFRVDALVDGRRRPRVGSAAAAPGGPAVAARVHRRLLGRVVGALGARAARLRGPEERVELVVPEEELQEFREAQVDLLAEVPPLEVDGLVGVDGARAARVARSEAVAAPEPRVRRRARGLGSKRVLSCHLPTLEC